MARAHTITRCESTRRSPRRAGPAACARLRHLRLLAREQVGPRLSSELPRHPSRCRDKSGPFTWVANPIDGHSEYLEYWFYPRSSADRSHRPMEGENGPPRGVVRSRLQAGGSAEAAAMIHSSGVSPGLEVSSLVYLTFKENCALCPCLRPSNHRPVTLSEHTPLHVWHTIICIYLASALEMDRSLLLNQRSRGGP